jgi:hypothetical protein
MKIPWAKTCTHLDVLHQQNNLAWGSTEIIQFYNFNENILSNERNAISTFVVK